MTAEPDPDELSEELERLISEAGANRDPAGVPDDEMHPTAQKHADVVRRGAGQADETDS